MVDFADLFKGNKATYLLVFSAITTVVLLNEAAEFADKIIKNKMLLVFSLLVFVLLFNIAIKTKLWVKQ